MTPESLRVGVFGGSFNPPHVGHVLAATYALLIAPLDRIVVVPVFQHPFSKELAPYEDRLEMSAMCFAPLPAVSISTVERELGGESLTLRTVEHLAAVNPSWKLRLIIGSDVVPDLPKWHRFDRIAEIADPFIIARGGVEKSFLPELSSTEVRALFARGAWDDLATLMPRRALDFARARGLYGAAPSNAASG